MGKKGGRSLTAAAAVRGCYEILALLLGAVAAAAAAAAHNNPPPTNSNERTGSRSVRQATGRGDECIAVPAPLRCWDFLSRSLSLLSRSSSTIGHISFDNVMDGPVA